MRVSVGFGVGPFRVSQTLLRTGGRRRPRGRAVHVQHRRPRASAAHPRVAPLRTGSDVRAEYARAYEDVRQTLAAERARAREDTRQKVAAIEAKHEARWGHVPIPERPIYAMTTRQAWLHKAWFRWFLLTAAGAWALILAIAVPPSLAIMVPLGIWLLHRHQRAMKARNQAAYDAQFANVGTFDTEAAAREAEAFGLPSEVFRMTQTAPEIPPRSRHSA